MIYRLIDKMSVGQVFRFIYFTMPPVGLLPSIARCTLGRCALGPSDGQIQIELVDKV